MIDQIITWDKELFLFLNGLHSGFWDVLMFNISNKFLWIPLYILLLFLLIRYYKKDSVWIVLTLILIITISDQVSVHGFKNVFLRLRPCHDPELDGLVHIVNGKCGGKYGFYSSHATNHFALAVFFSFIFKPFFRYFTPVILIWAGMISYSRIYLGVHFPADVLAGSLAGTLLGFMGFKILKLSRPGIFVKQA